LDACDPAQRSSLANELGIIKEVATRGVAAKFQRTTDTTWDLWADFCQNLWCDPYLANIHYFKCLHTSTAQDAWLPAVLRSALEPWKEPFEPWGRRSPHWDALTPLDLRLSRQLSAYKKEDPPPTRVKPVPLPIITHAADLCYLANTASCNAIADMLLLGFYFLLRPGEYAYTDNPDAAPFRICDVHLLINNRRIPYATATQPILAQVNFVALEFTTQKNGVRGELVGLGLSGHPTYCPVKALLRRVSHLKTYNAPPTTPLYSFYHHRWSRIDTSILTTYLRNAVTTLGARFGIAASDISIRSLRSSGAMALLCARVDTDMIRLLGRWRSDEMLRYLHVQTFPIVAPLARQMFQHGGFTMLPNLHGANRGLSRAGAL